MYNYSYGGEESAYRVSVGKLKGRRPLRNPGVDWRIILRWTFEKWDGGMNWIGLAQKRIDGGFL